MCAEKIGDCFSDDCRVFLSKFKNKNSLLFDAFAEVWQELKFSFVLAPWKYLGEMQEIVEEYLKVCKTIWLKSVAVEDRVCGLYLLRAIYLKQPASQHVKISMSHDDWQYMKHFLYVIKDFVQNETRFVLHELFEINAFTISVPGCTSAEGKDDGGILESAVAEFEKSHTEYREMLSELQKDTVEYNEQRKTCLRVYPELHSCTNAETDSLVAHVKERLSLFEEEVGKLRDDLLEANVTPASSMYGDESASEETRGRMSRKKKKPGARLKAMDCFESEESSDSEDDDNILDMPQLHSEDSDTGMEDEESCNDPSDQPENIVKVHMSDFEMSSVSSQDEESPEHPKATSSGEGRLTIALPEPRQARTSAPRGRAPSGRRGRRPRGRSVR